MNTQKQDGEECGGYTNFETWRVMDYINNGQRGEIYNHWLKIAGELQDAEKLRELLFNSYAVELNPTEAPGVQFTMFYGDLLENALHSRVNWLEIAEALTEDVNEATRANMAGEGGKP